MLSFRSGNWYSHAAVDPAGSMRLRYRAGARIVKVPCTGRLSIPHWLKGLEKGAAGVFVSGSPVGRLPLPDEQSRCD
jgi:coenzyme F420-reducing hydrogenase delta subunit